MDLPSFTIIIEVVITDYHKVVSDEIPKRPNNEASDERL